MTPRELERLEKDSIYTVRVNSDLKDQVVNSHLNDFSKFVKSQIGKRELIILLLDERKLK